MKLRLYYNTTTVAAAIAVIIISTATLSYLSYSYTVGRENLVETSLVQSNLKLATQALDRIEQKIIDNDRILSDMVNVDEPSRWPEQVEAIKQADLNVEQVYFLRPDSNIPIFPPYSDSIRLPFAPASCSGISTSTSWPRSRHIICIRSVSTTTFSHRMFSSRTAKGRSTWSAFR
jgi:hypothetical protein